MKKSNICEHFGTLGTGFNVQTNEHLGQGLMFKKMNIENEIIISASNVHSLLYKKLFKIYLSDNPQ